MSSLILPHRHTRQPPLNTAIDLSNPLAKGVEFVHTGGSLRRFSPINSPTTVAAAVGWSTSFLAANSQYLVANTDGFNYPLTFFVLARRGAIGADQALMSIGASTNDRHLLYFLSSNGAAIFSGTGSTYGQAISAETFTSTTRFYAVAGVVESSSSRKVYVDGKLLATNTSIAAPLASNKVAVGAYWAAGAPIAGFYNTGDIALSILFRGAKSDSEIKRLSENPWQIFRPVQRKIWVPAASGGAAALAGNAAAQSTSSGALTTAIQIAASAISTATAEAGLTTSISLSGQAASVSLADGVLTTSISLSGSALAQALASAGLSTAIPLDGAAVSSASASGLLTTQITLSGAALAQALASASLTTAPAGLAADAAASASASADLMTAIPLAGDASAIAIGAGGLTTGILLQAAGASVSSATGDLTVSFGMSAAAMASALATGDLSTQIQLSASALAMALASASLTSGAFAYQTPSERTLTLRAERRTLAVHAENRILRISHENRILNLRPH